MRLPPKSGFAMAAILAASFGYASWAQAAPLAGVAAAVPAVQIIQAPSVAEALLEKAFIRHRPWMRYQRHRRHKWDTPDPSTPPKPSPKIGPR